MTLGRRPVALGSGWIRPSETPSHTQTTTTQRILENSNILPEGERTNKDDNEKQVIVVVTDSWTVLCYSAEDLRLQWESHVTHTMPPYLRLTEVSVVVVPNALRIGDRGAVIVGGRLVRKQGKVELQHHTHHETDEQSEADASAEEGHYSYFAFDGQTGRLRWKHSASDFLTPAAFDEDVDDMRTLLRESSFKRHVINGMDDGMGTFHLGEMKSSLFHRDLLDSLPSRWLSAHDSEIRVARFERQRETGGKEHAATSSKRDEKSGPMSSVRRPHVHLSNWRTRWRREHQHVERPNVLVSYTHTGIEVIHLFSGRMVTQLPLQRDRLYTELNNDGIVDSAHVVSSKDTDGSALGQCSGVLLSGVPPTDPILSVDICRAHSGFFGSLVSSAAVDRASIEASTPTTLRYGRRLLDVGAHHYQGTQVLFLNSAGTLTCVRPLASPSHRIAWQVDTDARWTPNSVVYNVEHRVESFPQEVDSEEHDAVALFGDNHVAVVDAQGHVLAVAQMDEPSLSRALFADFNGDGITDIVITTLNGVRGFALTHSTGANLLPLLFAFAGAIAMVTVARFRATIFDDTSNQTFHRKGRKHL